MGREKVGKFTFATFSRSEVYMQIRERSYSISHNLIILQVGRTRLDYDSSARILEDD